MTYRLGKLPARPDAVKFRLSRYLTLPKPPTSFGHEALVTDWGMLGNDQYGDCVWAGAAHETIVWNKAAGRDVTFSADDVLGDYSAVTGFNPAEPSTDQGTDMETAAKYRRKVGVSDANNLRHTVGAYLALDHRDPATIAAAAYLFGAVGLGIRFPGSAMDQFDAGKPWSVVRNSPIEGGHYIPVIGRAKSRLHCVTWGKVQPMTNAFVSKYADEAIVYLSTEQLLEGKTPEGFDLATLQADLAALS